MNPYYDANGITIYHGNCLDILPTLPADAIVISDPPYNVGYHYESYKDALSPAEYQQLLSQVFRTPSVMLHYPEAIFSFAIQEYEMPTRCVAWTYHANTPHQWRLIAWFGCSPDFTLVKQPYRNPTDRRIRALIEGGSQGASLYDWWRIEQVKNVAKKYDHPCLIPLEIMDNIVGITPAELIIDPFVGSGTTLVAAKKMKRKAIGIEIEERYCEMAAKRLAQNYFDFEEEVSS